LFIITFLALWITPITVGFITGKKLEAKPGLNKNHIWVSVSAIFLPIVLIILYQLSVGNIGVKTNSQLCSEFCEEKGYSASGMTPKNLGERICSCFDSDGQEIIKVPIGIIISNRQE
jgi:hypothetical protein